MTFVDFPYIMKRNSGYLYFISVIRRKYMDQFNLSLRQRKLLHYLQQQKDFTTGEELASHLHVSARTIRNDVNEINEILKNSGVCIYSKRRWGYLLEAEDEADLKKLSQSNSTFLSRDERVRHIVFRLCLSDTPVNLYDLEDEMYISRTTLEHDLHALRKNYILPAPHILFFRKKNNISIETDERKRRALLNRLFTENWNYNSRGNTYYQYQYLDERIVNLIMKDVNFYMTQYNIMMEDVNMVILNLSIAIMYYRITSGYVLTEPIPYKDHDSASVHAVDDLLDSLEKKLDCSFPAIEREDIYLHVSCSRMMDPTKLNFATVDAYFSPEIMELADTYIRQVHETYHIDFSENEDFYITFLQYLRYLSLPRHYFNTIDTHTDVSRLQFLMEFEIAFSIQPLALAYYGSYLDYTELLYLAFCISGALAYQNRTSPRLRTVIMCHLNLPSSWELKHQILSLFKDYIDLTALLPVYMKDSYDFSKIDLIITTANKSITEDSDCNTLLISPFFTPADQKNLDRYIRKTQIQNYYKTSFPPFRELLQEAFWHERLEYDNYLSIIELLASDFIGRGYVSSAYLSDILRRESILTFAFQPTIVLMYSLTPSTKTCLSVATLEHRIKWNTYKIRTVIMAAIHPDDSTLIFQMINDLFYGIDHLEDAKFLKTKDEILELFH